MSRRMNPGVAIETQKEGEHLIAMNDRRSITGPGLRPGFRQRNTLRHSENRSAEENFANIEAALHWDSEHVVHVSNMPPKTWASRCAWAGRWRKDETAAAL
jgi:hypothetical protein